MNMLDWLLMVLKQVMLNPLSIPVVMLSMLYYREVSMAGFQETRLPFAGESATGKTFFVLGIVKQFLSDNPDGGVLYFESESAITKDMIEKRGIDSSYGHVTSRINTRVCTSINKDIRQISC